MTEAQTLDGMISGLGADLAPVRRLRPPAVRAAAWIGAVTLLGAVLCLFADVGAMLHRLGAAPDMALAVLGSTSTAVLGAAATFNLSLPDRKAAWAWLPVPGLILWVGASGMGCLRDWLIPGTHDASMRESADCITFILGLSIPLSGLLVVMIRRGFTLHPTLTAMVGGLTSAAAAATLLNIFHPYDASATDLAVHLLAVLMVVGANLALSGRLLRPRQSR